MGNINRRDFLTASGAAAASLLLPQKVEAKRAKSQIYVVYGTDVKTMLEVGVAKMGGWKSIVSQGKKATVKPNAAWDRRPDQGANTDPVLVGACVAALISSGASEVVVPENTCSDADKAFAASGIGKAVEANGGRIYYCDESKFFKEVTLPKAKSLTEAAVAIDVIDTGCLINMPVVKHHGSTGLTCSMKNWMGSVKVRATWHLWNLEQKIADMSTLLRPNLIIADATRVLLTEGPRGPGRVSKKNQLIFGTDPVAVDAYAATLIGKKPFDIEHIKLANDMGIGVGDLDQVKIIRVKT